MPSDQLWSTLCHLNTPPDNPIVPDPNFLLGGILIGSGSEFRARAVCYLNPNHVIDGVAYASFGYLYCEDNMETFQALTKAISELISKHKVSNVLGPMNGSTWNEYRLVSSEQAKPFLLEPVTAPYLNDFFQQNNWKQHANYYSQHTVSMKDNWFKMLPKYEAFVRKGVQFSEFDKSKAKSLFTELSHFCNKAFANNYLFSPISTADFVAKMMKVLPILDPSLTVIARNESKEIVGFIFAYEDLLNPTQKTLVIKTLARSPLSIYRGIGSVLMAKVTRIARRKNFVAAIHALMMETNVSNKISSKFSGTKFRTYSLYSKSF